MEPVGTRTGDPEWVAEGQISGEIGQAPETRPAGGVEPTDQGRGPRRSEPAGPGRGPRRSEAAGQGHDPRRSGDALGILADAGARAGETLALARRHLDPSLVDVLQILGFDRSYVSARGSWLRDIDGREYLDLHSGEGFASLGHNHPDVREVLRATLDADLLDGVQIHYSVLAGMLAEELCARLPDALDAVFFTSTGAEAVDTAMKFARAATRRPRLLSCDSSFHGVTMGPLSLVGDNFFKQGFGPLLPGCKRVPFGDLERLEAQLRKRDVAAFIVEPIQGRMVTLPPEGYLQAAQELCRRYGTLFVVDEIQTGLGRTGRWFALDHWGLEPDFVLVGKALSGGYMPVAATVMRREIYQRAVGTLERSYVHQSTYGRNRLAMAAGLATIRILARDDLLANVQRVGCRLQDGLIELSARHELISGVRARGLMIGIELGAPRSRWQRVNWRLIHLASEGLFPQLLVIPLHRDHQMITMAAGKNDVIKLLPPLTLSEAEADRFLDAFDTVLSESEAGSGANWGVVREIATATLRRRAGREERNGHERPPTADPLPRGTPVDPARGNLCLLTGASGFIGGHTVERLLGAGYQVRCLVRPTSDTALLEELGVELAFGDLTNPRSLEQAAANCRYAIHCGALVSDWATVAEITRINVTGTRNVLRACAAAGVERLVHLSTTDVYGHPGTRGIAENHAQGRFSNWYSQTKRQAEAEVLAARAEHGMETVILRPATVYGPRSIGVVGQIAHALRARNMVLIGNGRAVAGLCYVENLVDAALLALTHDAAPGEAFNVTDGLEVTWRRFTRDLADGLACPEPRWSIDYRLARAMGRGLEGGYRGLRRCTGLRTAPLLSRQAVDVLGVDQHFSSARARRLLGWAPRIDYETGLEATLGWLRSDLRLVDPAGAPGGPGVTAASAGAAD